MSLSTAAEKWSALRNDFNTKVLESMLKGDKWIGAKSIIELVNLNKKLDLGKLSDQARFVNGMFKDQINEDLKKLAKSKSRQRRNAMGDKLVKGLNVVNIGLSAYRAVDSTTAMIKHYETQQAALNLLDSNLTNYKTDTEVTINNETYCIPARTSLDNVESACRATVGYEVCFDAAMITTVTNWVDATMAVCAVIPGANVVAAAYVVINQIADAGKAAKDVCVNAYYLYDRLFWECARPIYWQLKNCKKPITIHQSLTCIFFRRICRPMRGNPVIH